MRSRSVFHNLQEEKGAKRKRQRESKLKFFDGGRSIKWVKRKFSSGVGMFCHVDFGKLLSVKRIFIRKIFSRIAPEIKKIF